MYHFRLIEQGLKTSEYSKCIQGQKSWFIQKLLLSLWDPKRFIFCSFLSSFWVRWEPAVHLLLVKHCLETFPFVIGLFSGRGCSDITTIPGLSLLINFQVNSSIKNIRLLVIECFPSSGASVCGWHMLDLYNTILRYILGKFWYIDTSGMKPSPQLCQSPKSSCVLGTTSRRKS